MKRLFVILTLIGSLTNLLTTSCSNAQEHEFVFNPPLGLEFVETTVSKELGSMNGKDFRTKQTHIRAKSIVEGIDSNFLITTEAISIEYFVDGEPTDEPMYDFMANMVYQLEVDKNGQLVGIYGLDGLVDSLISGYSPEIREIMSRLFNEDYFYGVLIEEWNSSVGNFAGKRFEIGEIWEEIDTMQTLIGSMVCLEKSTEFAELVECCDNRCVRIKYDYSANPDISKEQLVDFLENIFGSEFADSLEFEMGGLKIFGEGERIIDPATMMVYSEYEKKVTELEFVTKTEGSFSFRKEEIDEGQFKYINDSD